MLATLEIWKEVAVVVLGGWERCGRIVSDAYREQTGARNM